MAVEQLIEGIDAAVAVEALNGGVEGLAKSGVLLIDPPERFLQELAVGNGGVPLDQLAQLDADPFLRQRIEALSQHVLIRARVERKALVEVGEEKTVGIEAELDLLRFERLAVRLAEDGEEDLLHGFAVHGDGAPGDVEVMKKARLRPVFQHAHPPGVLRAGSHVIRDDVEQQAELPSLQLLVQRGEIILAAELRIQRRGVDHVVAVSASLARPQNRRCVNVTDAEVGEITGDGARVGNSESGIELKPVGGARDAVHYWLSVVGCRLSAAGC